MNKSSRDVCSSSRGSFFKVVVQPVVSKVAVAVVIVAVEVVVLV